MLSSTENRAMQSWQTLYFFVQCVPKKCPPIQITHLLLNARYYTSEFKIGSKPNSNTKMSNYKLITNSSKNALEWFN